MMWKDANIRQILCALVVILAMQGNGRAAFADCDTIDQLGDLYILQSRLAHMSGTALFSDDVKQIHELSIQLTNARVIAAVDDGLIAHRSADFSQFLFNTRLFLQTVDRDDPQLPQPYFTTAVRKNLHMVGKHLSDLRCPADPANTGQPTPPGQDSTDETSDLAAVLEMLVNFAKKVLQLRNLAVSAAVIATIAFVAPVARQRLKHLRRRKKRRDVHFQTRYRSGGADMAGTLININCHGAKLRHTCPAPQPAGSAIEIVIFDKTIKGTVRWSNAHYSGIRFANRLKLSTVAAICGTDIKPLHKNTRRRPKGRRVA